MAEPGSYEKVVEIFDGLKDDMRKRLLRDSAGNWHTLIQNYYVLNCFDDLVGLDDEGDKGFKPDFEKGRQILDEAIAESKRTGFTIDMCFQLIVIKLHHEYEVAKIEAELDAEKKQP